MNRYQWSAASVYESHAQGDTTCRVCKHPISNGQTCLTRRWNDAKGISHQACGYWVLADLEADVQQKLRDYVLGMPIDHKHAVAFLYENLRARDGKWTKKGELLLAQVKESEPS